jgi:hypothetical protein
VHDVFARRGIEPPVEPEKHPAVWTVEGGAIVGRQGTPDYDPDAVLRLLGHRGHLALEVHDNDAMFGDARWGEGAACRWRNIRVKELDGE